MGGGDCWLEKWISEWETQTSSFPSFDLYSTPGSRAGVMAPFGTLAVETGPLYGKEMGTEGCRMSHAQATREPS